LGLPIPDLGETDWLKMLHEPISLCQVINAVNIINCVNDP